MRGFQIGTEGDAVLDLKCDVSAEVIPESLPHSREIVDLLYSKFPKFLSGADSRQHEDVRRPDGSGTQNDSFR